MLLFHLSLFSQKITRIEPQNWWSGMKYNNLTLLVYGNTISDLQPSITYAGVELIKTEKDENKNYLFVTLKFSPAAKAGMVKINFKDKNRVVI